MTTRTDLLEIIKNGENSGVEFKRDVVENHALARELVAFSNFTGGVVLLGVDDDGRVVGITRPNLEEWVMTACRDKIRPANIPFFEVVRDVEPGKDVALVRVACGFDVHSVWHQKRSTYFIRVGTQSREPTPEELGRLFQQRGSFRAELRPVSGATLGDLDLRRLRDYFGRIRQQEAPPDNDEPAWQTLLLNSDLMVEDGVTMGGLLLFGKTPNRSDRGDPRSCRQRAHSSRLPAVSHGHRDGHIPEPLRGDLTGAAPQWHHAGAHAHRLSRGAQPAP